MGLWAVAGPARAQIFGDADPFGSLAGLSTPIVPGAPTASPTTIQLAALANPMVVFRPAPSVAATPPVIGNGSPRSACLDGARAAESRHDLPSGLLVAIALNESGLHAYAMSIGGRSHFPETREQAANLYRSARGSVMAGCVQVNARVHARGDDWPLDAQRATDWAGRFLREAYARTGSWSEAVRIWHGGRPGTATRLACRIRAKMDVTAPQSGLFSDLNCGSGAMVARLRRNGQAHYEIAEASAR